MLILVIVFLVIASGVALTAQIRKDGYGSRPGPRSHHDSFETNLLGH